MSTTPAATKRKRLDSEASALRDFLEQVGSYTTDLIFGVPPGKGLYHYTDLAGLQGIISNNDLWLTDSRYSNDSEEMRHGYGVARRILETQQQQANQAADANRIEYLTKLAEFLAKPPAEAVYISCFCLEDNLLSQWRGYGGNGSGVCIELDAPKFGDITGRDSISRLNSPSKGLMRLWRVFYDSLNQDDIISEAIQFGQRRTGTCEDRARYAADAIFFFVPTFKHNDFKEEKECRLIFTPPPESGVNPRFRVSRGMLIPYYSVNELTSNSFRLPLKRIVVGPAQHKEINVGSIATMLAAYGYEGIPVEASGTPLRA